MEEKHNYWTSKGTLRNCNFSKTKFCNSTDNTKCIFLDPPLEFQDKPAEVIVENFAENFISKLFYEAFKMTCNITWAVPCSPNCHKLNLPFWNDSIQWNDLKLYLTQQVLRDKKLSLKSPLFSTSKHSLSKINHSKIENSKYTKTDLSPLFFGSKTISDVYSVPFDSDIYAIPLDVIKHVSDSQNQTKLLNSNARYYHSSSSFFGQCIFSGTSSVNANTNSNCSMKLYGSESVRCNIVEKSCLETMSTASEAIHITMEEVREYLKTLYSTSCCLRESRKFTNTVKYFKNPFKSIYNNLCNVSKPNILNNRETYIFEGEKKEIKNVYNFTTESQKLNSSDKLKSTRCRHNFPVNLKQILCSMFRIKKLSISRHNYCRNTNNICSEEKATRFSSDNNQNHANVKIKPSFSKRALPPLPRLQDDQKNTFHKECGSLHKFKETAFAPLPHHSPPHPSSSLTLKSRLTTNSVDFAASIEKVKNYGWYWGPISGEAAERILTNEPDGSFIVRDSSDDYYIFSLTFKLNSIIRHVRIEHDHGNFSFGNSTRFKSHTIVDFIESAVEHSRSGRYLFFLHRRPVLGPMRVQLLHPVSRFKQVQSLQHLSRFVILKIVRKDLISSLPLPKRLLNYLSTQHYYSETLTEDERVEIHRKDNVDQFIQFDEDGFS